MRALVIYDTLYGNTERVAHAIGRGINGEVEQAAKVNPTDLKDIKLLIVGSPTQGGSATPDIQEFLEEIPDVYLKDVKVAAFDTRFGIDDHGFGLKIIMNIFDFAAPKIARVLEKKGGKMVSKPEGFIVEGKEGPLAKGELERARHWAEKIVSMK